MEANRVKAVQEVSAGTAGHRKKNNEGKKSWSIQFLERLLREAGEREQEEQRGRTGQEDGERANRFAGGMTGENGGCDEADCRIVRQGEERVPSDWDSFEISAEWTETVLTSEIYVDIIDSLKRVGNWSASVLYRIAEAVLQDYYEGKLDERAVWELFFGCYQKCVEKNAKLAASVKRRQEILAALYEYFSRVNARKSVSRNEREGRRFVEECGLTWAGTTYYNSRFYYVHKDMKLLIQKACDQIAAREGLVRLSYGKIARESQFREIGGLTYHGVFVWIQKKDNHPEEQYGMRDLRMKPHQGFVYLYRNHYAKNEESRIRLLEQRLKLMHEERAMWLAGEGRGTGSDASDVVYSAVGAGKIAREGKSGSAAAASGNEAREGKPGSAAAASGNEARGGKPGSAAAASGNEAREKPGSAAAASGNEAREGKPGSAAAEPPRQLWRSYTQKDGRDYHNGMSYLLEGSLMDDQDESVYTEVMDFLRNFRLYRLSGCVEFLSVTEKEPAAHMAEQTEEGQNP